MSPRETPLILGRWLPLPLCRARVIFKFKALLDKNIDKLAELLTSQHGKILEGAKGEVLRVIELTEFSCGTPYLLKGSYSENVSNDLDSYTIRQPLGVCVGITPFNFPVMISAWMFVVCAGLSLAAIL